MGFLTREKVYAARTETVGDVIYIGEAAISSAESDSVWRIRRIDTAGVIEVKWAGGGAFVNAWDDRASLTYN